MADYHLTPLKRAVMEDGKFTERHKELVRQAEQSLDVALAQFTQDLTRHPCDSAAIFERIKGAHDFVRLFRNLCETADMPAITDSVNLAQNRKT